MNQHTTQSHGRSTLGQTHRSTVEPLPLVLCRTYDHRRGGVAPDQVAQPRRTIATAGVIFIALAAVPLLTGCRSLDPKLIAAMADNNAHIKVRVTSLYGTIEFERRMEFDPTPPPAPPAAANTNLVAELVNALRPVVSPKTPKIRQ